MRPSEERRKYPRVKDKNISVKLFGGGISTITQSLDVSASGIYCKIVKRVPIMTKVQVLLSLPGKTKGAAPVTMDIDGVVVREHPVKKDGKIKHYDVAIFFNTLMPKERECLIKYINRKPI
ncbi:MAG: PilZ domain-containing protein [Candidatus Omnitrophica bacterium]|nr:PilZ domain-containing protein [Candidatus Omnitrophota bacterium]